MHDFEKLGVFYLGRQYDLAGGGEQPEPLLYDAKDLTTHAVCVGMTGSGKTGLCLALLEEAGIDGVPAIAIDPKGDLGNLLLTFPELRGEDFRPWVDESEAARKNVSPDELAEQTAKIWREGLAAWDQQPERIRAFRSAVELAIYTPGSSAGLPITVLRSFAAPGAAVLADDDALRARIGASVSGLLALVGVDADPIRSREYILLAQILERAWRDGRDLDIAGLIHAIQKPPMQRVGVVDIESFFPEKERIELAMRLNNLLASPGFAGWMQGEPLDVGRLLYTPEGKPRLAIMSIAHLSDAERMFFVTILLGEILSWIRAQPGTSSLRAILYMDEIFGFFPPTANPPSKMPMLTLLKQARAYGLGIVLATQNPVDLDYKGLSNAGTWFLGRLQTERDKARVLEGLEGASLAAGTEFDRTRMEATLAALGNRVFLLNNVHEDEPAVFKTRWCLSYLRGPLTRMQIQSLMAPYKRAHQPTADTAASEEASEPQNVVKQLDTADHSSAPTSSTDRPFVPREAQECFMPFHGETPEGSQIVYRPTLIALARLHFVDAKSKIDHWRDVARIAALNDRLGEGQWDEARPLAETHRQFDQQPIASAQFAPVPSAALRPKSYAKWQKSLAAYLYRHERLNLWRCPQAKQYSQVDESEAEFRIRMRQWARERRDEALAKLRQRFAAKHATLDDKIRRASQRIERERAEYHSQVAQTAVSVGSSLLNALLGRKLASQTNVRRAGSAARGAARTARSHSDIARAEKTYAELLLKQKELDRQLAIEAAKVERSALDVEATAYPLRPRKTDVAVERLALVWVPTV